MGQDDMQGRSRAGRWTRPLLIGSLALNLLVVGGLAGVIMTQGAHRHGGPPGLHHMGGPMTRALGPDDRHAIARQMRAAYRDGRPGRAAQRAALGELIAALGSEPFDRAAAEASMTRLRGLMQERLTLAQAALLDRLESMSPKSRAAYAARLDKALHRDDRRKDP